jgi:hypothetical protein
VISGKAGKSARRANGDGVAGETGGTAVRAGAGGG